MHRKTMQRLTDQVTDTISVVFHKDQRSKLKLIETSKELLKIVESGEDLYVKGSGQEEVVLCNQSQSFVLKRVETSNSVFLLPTSADNRQFSICGKCVDYYEAKPAKGKVQDIAALVDELSSQSLSPKQFRSELFRRTRASEAEIESALQRLGAMETAAGMRIVTAEEIVAKQQVLFNAILAHSLSTELISMKQCAAINAQLTGDWLPFLFRSLRARPAEENASHALAEEDKLWALDRQRLAEAAARILFMQKQIWEQDSFEREWMLTCPCESAFDASVLRGIALSVSCAKERTWVYLPTSSMPSELQPRLERLFTVKNELSADELQPYFEDFVGDVGQPKTVVELLLGKTRFADGKYFKS